MQHNVLGSKDPSKQLHTIAESVRSTTEGLSSEMSHKATQLAEEASETVTQYSKRATSWLRQNPAQVLGMVTLVATVTLLGYWAGRNGQEKRNNSLSS